MSERTLTPEQLRARDERIIRAAWVHWFDATDDAETYDAIIAQADEADQ